MSEAYTMVPYLMTMKTKYERGDHTRPVDDIDNQGLKMIDAVGSILMAAQSQGTFRKQVGKNQSGERSYKLIRLSKSDHALYFEIQVGTKGVRSTLIDEDNDVTFQRTTKVPEMVTLRHWMLFPAGGYHAVLYIEQLQAKGALRFLGKVLVDSLRARFAEITTQIRPLTTFEGLQAASYDQITFKAPMARDARGHMLDDGTQVVVQTKFRGGRSVKKLQNDDGTIEPKKVFGVLERSLGQGSSAQDYSDSNWTAVLAVKLPSGHQRSFRVGSKSAPGIVYSVKATGAAPSGQAIDDYPSFDDFRDVCVAATNELSGHYSLGANSADLLDVPQANWHDQSIQRIKVVWDDSSTSSTNPAGPVPTGQIP